MFLFPLTALFFTVCLLFAHEEVFDPFFRTFTGRAWLDPLTRFHPVLHVYSIGGLRKEGIIESRMGFKETGAEWYLGYGLWCTRRRVGLLTSCTVMLQAFPGHA
jgi:hypothetical protein